MEEYERDVEVLKVAMVKVAGGGWDAHVTMGCSNPRLVFGTFVISGVHTPEEYAARLPSAARDFAAGLEGESFEVTN
jgi:hypothetical protein